MANPYSNPSGGGVFDMFNAPGVNGNPAPTTTLAPQTTNPANTTNTITGTANPYGLSVQPNNTTNTITGTPDPYGMSGLFKIGAEKSYRPIQETQAQGPRYRINEAMMRSPYYNPYFSSFQ